MVANLYMNDLTNHYNYTVIRSRKRKTAAIRISEKGVEVRVPHWVSDQWVSHWVDSKAHWISENSAKLAGNLARTCLKVSEGALFPYKGSSYPISWYVASQNKVTLKEGQLLIAMTNRSQKPLEERAKGYLQKWYKAEAELYLSERALYWQDIMGLRFNLLIIKSYKRRWGSCNSHGDISFNWRLIFADKSLVDYVVIHELAHLVHLNHSPEFWQLVGRYCEDWKLCRDQLQKCNGWILW